MSRRTLPASAVTQPFRAPALGHDAAIATLLGRHAIRFDVEGLAFQAVLAAPSAAPPAAILLGWTAGACRGELMLPGWLVERLLRAVEPAPRSTLDAATRLLLLELALEQPLGRLEAALGAAVQLTTPTPAPAHGSPADGSPADASPVDASGASDRVAVGLDGDLDGEAFTAALHLPRAALDRLRRLATALTLAPRPVEPPLILAVRIGIARLGIGMLRTLAAGDAVLVEAAGRHRAALVAGEHLAALAALVGNTLTLEAPLRAAASLGLEEWTMTASRDAALAPEDASVDALQVTLVFELSRQAATLAEVRALGVGHVITLDAAAEPTVSVLANGRRIGQGTLVQVGDALAVRLTRLAIT